MVSVVRVPSAVVALLLAFEATIRTSEISGNSALGPGNDRSGTRETPDVESSTAAYARRFSGAVGRWFLDVQLRSVRELLGPLVAGATIADVGGGHGQLAPPLALAGYDVTVVGSDGSCQALLAPHLGDPRLHFQVGDLLDLPFGDRSFDASLSIRLLGHLRNWRHLIHELCRVSKRSVILDYASTRSVNRLAASLFDVKQLVEGDTRTFTVFRPRDIRDAFAAEGFRITAVKPQFLLPMALHRFHRSASLGRVLEAPGRVLGLTKLAGSPLLVRADRIA